LTLLTTGSVAVPVIVRRLPLGTEEPADGKTTAVVGATWSADFVALTSGRCGSAPGCKVVGCTSMSASRLTVACCIAWSGVCAACVSPRSCKPSRPHDHWTVTEPKTLAHDAWTVRAPKPSAPERAR